MIGNHKMGNRKVLGFGVSAMALMLGSVTAGAQTAPVQVAMVDEGDIVVTARRTEERLQDVPIAVSVFSAQELQRQGIDDLSDVAERTVGFSFEAITPIVVQPAIRGQTNLRTTSPVQNVPIYVDGIYLQRGYMIDQALVELERVEIIKGPQSALYGRNAFAGAINLTTRAPSLTDIEGRISGTIGNYDRYDARGFVSIPIIKDKLAVMGSIAHSQYDGSWENQHPLADADGALTKGNLGGWNRETYQVRVLAKPVENLTIDALYIRTERTIDSQPGYTMATSGSASKFNTLNASPVANAFGVKENRLFAGEMPADPVLVTGETRSPGLVSDPRAYGLKGPTELVSAKVEWAGDGPFTAAYQFGYTRAKVTARGSPTRDPLVPLILFGTNFGTLFDASGSDSSFKGYSHEVRFTYNNDGPFRALFGVNYSKTKDIDSNGSEVAVPNSLVLPDPNAFFPIGPGLPFPRAFFQRNTYLQRDENIMSGFAFLGYKVSDQLEITLEGRYTIEDQEARDFLVRPLPPANTEIQAAQPTRFQRSSNFFTPRGTITYKATSDNMVYASVAKGVKSGGLNGNVPYVPQQTFEEESNWTYEIGTKNSFFDRALTINIAAYHTDWKNLQTNAVRLQASGAPPASFVAIVPSLIGNIGGVKVTGAEIEGIWRVAAPVRIDFGLSYNRSRYTDETFSQRFGASGNCDGIVCATIPGTPTRVLPIGGNQIERIPELDARAGVTFDGQFGDKNDWFARGDVSYQTKSYVDEANLSWVPDRLLFNASAGVSFGRFSVNAFVKNIADKKYVSSSLFLIGTGGAFSASYVPTLGERRTFGLTGAVNF
nr:TonB-dependent receptor [Polymorphobacter sp.]